MTTSNTNSRTSSLSEEDLAAIAGARASEDSAYTRRTSSLEIPEVLLKLKDVSHPPIEQSSVQYKPKATRFTSSLQPTIGQQNITNNDIQSGQKQKVFGMPLAEESLMSGYVFPGAFDGRQNSAMHKQIGGTHYKEMRIQPIEFIYANGIGFIEGCIIKYVCRWKAKGGIQDLKKVRHYIDILIEYESNKGAPFAPCSGEKGNV